MAEIEGKALQEYEGNPKLAIDKPQLLKQVKQAGGIDLNEQGVPMAPAINIKSIENLQILMSDMIAKRLEKKNNIDTK